MKKKITLLLIGLSESGKTSSIATLSNCPYKIMEVAAGKESRTQITVDYEFHCHNKNDLRLTSIEINNKAVFGNTFNHTARAFNDNLNKNQYLNELFKFEPQDENLSIEQVNNYVNKKIDDFISKSDFTTIKDLMLNRENAKYIRRITVSVPPNHYLREYLKRENIIFVARDSKGALDLTVNEIEQIFNKTYYDLGMDGLNGILLICSSNPFVNIVNELYKHIFSEIFKSIPIFILTRHDTFYEYYDMKYNDENVKLEENEELNRIKKVSKKASSGEEKLFRNILDKNYKNAIDLLVKCNAVEADYGFVGNKYTITGWHFVYEYFNLKDMLYITPIITTLSRATNPSEIDFDAEDYQFYKKLTYINFTDMINKILQVEKILKEIEDGSNVNYMIRELSKNEISTLEMYPNYRYDTQKDIGEEILSENIDLLGPREGITTFTHGRLRYKAALACAVTSFKWITNIEKLFDLQQKLINSDGKIIAPDMSLEQEKKLIKRYISNCRYKKTDAWAGYQQYSLIDRNLIVDSIINIRKNKTIKPENALKNVVQDVIETIFKL